MFLGASSVEQRPGHGDQPVVAGHVNVTLCILTHFRPTKPCHQLSVKRNAEQDIRTAKGLCTLAHKTKKYESDIVPDPHSFLLWSSIQGPET